MTALLLGYLLSAGALLAALGLAVAGGYAVGAAHDFAERKVGMRRVRREVAAARAASSEVSR